MNIEKIEEDTYKIEISDQYMKVRHFSLPGVKNTLFNRFLRNLQKPNSAAAFVFILVFLGYPAVSILLLLSFMTVPFFFMLMASVPLMLSLAEIYKYSGGKFKGTFETAQVPLFRLPKISKLSNKHKAVEKYFNSLSPQKQESLFKNVKMFSELNKKDIEFDNLATLMEDNSVLRKDIVEQKRVLEKSQERIREYLNDFEQKVVSNSADDAFLATMAAFTQLVSEEEEMLKEETLSERRTRTTENRYIQ